jgi:hypothetical protein
MNQKEFIQTTYGDLVGRKIVAVRPLAKKELEEFYWEETWGSVALCVILDDGQVLIPAQDPELNGPGYLLLADLAPIKEQTA